MKSGDTLHPGFAIDAQVIKESTLLIQGICDPVGIIFFGMKCLAGCLQQIEIALRSNCQGAYDASLAPPISDIRRSLACLSPA